MRRFLLVGLALGCCTMSRAAEEGARSDETPAAAEQEKTERPKIYDESADGEKQIAAGLAIAKKANKRVLLQFGANWCVWCHRLHQLFEKHEDVRKKLDADYVVVMIDVNEKHNREIDEKYEHPTKHGLPAIVILDADGKQLTTKNTAELEEGDHHNPEKVLAFLAENSGSEPVANIKASGNIEVDGKPLAEGKITFYANDGQFVGSKVKEGRFEIDHAWVGDFKIAIEGNGVPAKYGFAEMSGLAMQLTGNAEAIVINLQSN